VSVPSEGKYKRSKRDHVPYDGWAKTGHIEATEGNVIDYEVIRARINELSEKYQIKEIAIDRWNATQLATQLSGDGFSIVAFGQGYASMSVPTKELEKLVLGKQLNHGKRSAGRGLQQWRIFI